MAAQLGNTAGSTPGTTRGAYLHAVLDQPFMCMPLVLRRGDPIDLVSSSLGDGRVHYLQPVQHAQDMGIYGDVVGII